MESAREGPRAVFLKYEGGLAPVVLARFEEVGGVGADRDGLIFIDKLEVGERHMARQLRVGRLCDRTVGQERENSSGQRDLNHV